MLTLLNCFAAILCTYCCSRYILDAEYRKGKSAILFAINFVFGLANIAIFIKELVVR